MPGPWVGLLVCVLFVLSLAGTLVGGTPTRLPGIALGSPVLLHVERVIALFAALFLALVVLVRAFQGRLPTELSGRGVKYAERETTEEIRDSTATALENLETAQRELAARIDALEERPP